MRFRGLIAALILALAGGCAVSRKIELDRSYGKPDPAARSTRARSTWARSGQGIDFQRLVRPILENRCAVCHGCYDAPCQLKLTSYEGIERGASKQIVYDGTRLFADPLTRLYFDAVGAAQWREKGFHPVLNEREPLAEANLEAGVLYQMLELRRRNPLPESGLLPDSIDLQRDRDQQCPTIEEFEIFAADYPLWGMPYALPPLGEDEFAILRSWIEQGAPYNQRPALGQDYLKRIHVWEEFFNGNSFKEQLMSRYIYEHLFLAHLYFDDLGGGEFFELVRSKTPPGTPIEVIAARRPFDDPAVPRVYYRLRRLETTPVYKSHMPYSLGKSRMARWRELFLNSRYSVSSLPSYEPKLASNPFKTFAAIPAVSRYKFMLDEAQFTIMGFIKGPVCRGQVALNVIDEQFWILFVDPDWMIEERDGDFLNHAANLLQLPAEHESNATLLANWFKYSSLQQEYLGVRSEYFKKRLKNGEEIRLELIWNGGGRNKNAALTVLRHQDSASIVKGLIGPQSKTAWLLGYPLLERIHYLLVAGFDVYGNYGHQVLTRLYMDFMRMEGESYFLALLPPEARRRERDFWYRGAEDVAKKYVLGSHDPYGDKLGIDYRTDDPKRELFSMLRTHLGQALDRSFELTGGRLPRDVASSLKRLAAVRGQAASILPQISYLEVSGVGVFSVLPNSAYSNLTSLLHNDDYRLPEEDTITVARGFIGAYPNAFWRVDRASLPELVERIANVRTEEDYRAIMADYGIRRTNRDFWAASDRLHRLLKEQSAIEYAVLDYNRYENR